MGRLEGQVALVTGAARGIGRAQALRLASEGASLALVDACERVARTEYPASTLADLDETAEVVSAHGGRVIARQSDVRDGDRMTAIAEEVMACLGRLDIVVASAAVGRFRPFVSLDDDEWDEVISVNLTGVQRTLRAALPSMIAANNGGSVVITGSVASIKAIPYEAHYTAAKHGIVGLMRVLAVELAEHGIRVNCVHPGGVRTAMGTDEGARTFLRTSDRAAIFSASFRPLSRPGSVDADEIAEATVWLSAASGRSITGQNLIMDCGVTVR
jgi:NAD(P)-dependent dehydrogenase (short-subunit alcohol dehydrogenase family)